ncbi:putative ring finger domain protein [Rosellinia necatrix]|uniref:RING-type E3 ubiquitin transferase n=1 Tax=Rosellinia necatrix TaxID=77044 RepID=A0A1S7UNM1_ROSNE|nr:putative ring finger domain protein [Rosellinia necatrix]
MDTGDTLDDLQSKVLRSTLAEVAARSEPTGEPTGESIGESTSEQRPNELCCVICLDTITEPCEARPCKHRNFDYLCLLNWLERLSKCPLCKCDIHEVVHDFDHDGNGTNRVYLVPQVANSAPRNEQLRARPDTPSWAAGRPDRRWHEHARRPPVTRDGAVIRRQQIYRDRLYSLHVGSNPTSRYRDITPALFESEPDLVSRARAWLRRELQVFGFLRTPSGPQSSEDAITRRRANNAEFLLEYIIAILKTVDIQGSQGAAEDMLSEFLGRENTKLLLHELRNFLRSPWSIEVWDCKVQYPSTMQRAKCEGGHDERRRGSRRGGPIRNRNRGQLDRERTGGDFYRPSHSRFPHGLPNASRQNNPD